MRNWITSAVAVGALLGGSPVLAQDVHVDSNPSAPFASYRTYTWTNGTPASNQLAEQRIRSAVDQQLAAKGFTQVSENPDVVVATHVVTKEKQQLNVDNFGGYGLGFGYGYGFGGPATATIETYTVGTLAVDIYDANTKMLVWRGTGSGTVSEKPSKNTRKVDKALAKMFTKYPPSPGTK